ncbi:glycoside hydrolase family 6 protein [Curtobacterium sp. MCBD17_028]|uniref:glycoside hydrolase family 6 protein n=1 Tax=Curtobacterium sp. MCBD17_028 TaxID=2175670 RepID=UPI000DA84DFD|nr:glycoside hydrolase family 6 protein [Curtobacterium sp. MCBD17_028]PZE26427.1 hypothetical protein DEI86_08030 [Curtobacterium sp. MCBD17_028]
MLRSLCAATAGIVAAAAAVVSIAVVPVSAASAASGTPLTAATVHSAASSGVFAGGPYREPTSQAAQAASSLAAAGDSSGAAAARAIAQYPVAIWLGEWYSNAQLVDLLTSTEAAAAGAGATPVYVTYAIPNRDCGGYSSGGMTATQYTRWVDLIASTLRGKRAAVMVEPDSLAMLSSCPDEATSRYALLSHEVSAFTAAGVPAYLDGGNSNWVPPATMAQRLRSAGVADARGFFSNVANYYPTAQEQAYDQQVSAATGGAHYVIDTSRNGQGWRGTWCNGPGAGLGAAPRVVDDGTALDALLWVKTPGASDGSCGGAPAAGEWYPSYARALVANAVLDANGTVSASSGNGGTTAPAGSAPKGSFDRATAVTAGVTVQGWAFDPDATRTPLSVRITVDGAATTITANVTRPDVARAYGVTAAHGFSATVPATSGKHAVCASAAGVAGGGDSSLGCRTVTVPSVSPKGSFDSATGAAGGIRVAGWAFDGDQTGTALTVRAAIGSTTTTFTADTTRKDVARVYGAGASHGFTALVPAAAGSRRVCLTAVSVGGGADTSLGCKTVTVPNTSR